MLAQLLVFFFFNDTATTEIYTLSLHDALPILAAGLALAMSCSGPSERPKADPVDPNVIAIVLERKITFGSTGSALDRKSTRLNSSHLGISYAVFCLKKKKKTY